MFEEIEARAYHELNKRIKAYIKDMVETAKIFRNKADNAINCGLESEYEYFDGSSRSLTWVVSDLNSIIKTVERVTKKEIEVESKQFAEYVESEMTDDTAR